MELRVFFILNTLLFQSNVLSYFSILLFVLAVTSSLTAVSSRWLEGDTVGVCFLKHDSKRCRFNLLLLGITFVRND